MGTKPEKNYVIKCEVSSKCFNIKQKQMLIISFSFELNFEI